MAYYFTIHGVCTISECITHLYDSRDGIKDTGSNTEHHSAHETYGVHLDIWLLTLQPWSQDGDACQF